MTPTVDPYEVDGQSLTFAYGDAYCKVYRWSGSNSFIEKIEILQARPFGNCYHKKNDVEFEILEGVGALYRQGIDRQDNKPIGRIITLPVMAGDKKKIPAFKAYAFVLLPGSKMICRSNKRWGSADEHFFELVK